MKNIVIVGAGGFGREVAWLIEDINSASNEWKLLGYIDENADNHGKVLNGFPVLGDLTWFEGKADVYYVCAIGNGKVKEKVVGRCNQYNIKAATLIHPSVHISSYNKVGEGCIVCAGSIITVNVELGNHVIVNIDSTIGHDAVIEDYCTILPSVNVSGNVLIGKASDIGTGTAIIQGVKIGSKTIVGAGAIVVKDLPDNCTAVGAPAKAIKFHE